MFMARHLRLGESVNVYFENLTKACISVQENIGVGSKMCFCGGLPDIRESNTVSQFENGRNGCKLTWARAVIKDEMTTEKPIQRMI